MTASSTPEQDLYKIMLLAGLKSEVRRKLLESVFIENHELGKKILQEDQSTTDVFFILEGQVEISVRTKSGYKIHFERINEGEYFGEFSAIDGAPRSAEVLAIKATRLIRMPQDVFMGLLVLHPRVAMQLMRRLVAIIRSSNSKIVDIATLTVIERLYNHFLQEGKSSGTHQICVRNVPSQSDLAAQIGASRETVSRAMNKMIADQIIVRGDAGEIYVRNNVQIKDMAPATPNTKP